jgi:hypothetical protein
VFRNTENKDNGHFPVAALIKKKFSESRKQKRQPLEKSCLLTLKPWNSGSAYL